MIRRGRDRTLGAEHELMVRLAGTVERRRAARARIGELAECVDYRRLEALMRRQSLRALLGSRLVEAAPGVVPEMFRARVDDAVLANRRHAVLLDQTTNHALGALDAEGIVAMPLKGPGLAELLHGDPGLRVSTDVDILVERDHLETARGVLERAGYGAPCDPLWGSSSLPLLHYTLPGPKPWLPTVELHWRIHWYDTGFSYTMMESATTYDSGALRPALANELTALLCFYARDGMAGLRTPADIAAWWDRFGDALPEGALEEVASRHPKLRDAMAAAALAASRIVGFPAAEVLPSAPRARGRVGAAARLANWCCEGDDLEQIATLTTVDLLLAPAGQKGAWAGRHIIQPLEHIQRTYRLPANARHRQAVRSAVHALGASGRLLPRGLAGLAATRSGQAVWEIPGPTPNRSALAATSADTAPATATPATAAAR
jgi:hypothetical protein